MTKIEAIIERANDGTYSVYCVNEMFSGMGDSVESAKLDMLEQMKFFKETAVEDHHNYPNFLDQEFEVIYKFDTESLLEYYSGILSLSGLERITGIHQKQLWSYLHGKSKPRKAQIEKIENGLHRFGNELISISL
ncbi:MAG: DNA-binding protein [Paludibacter sp.]|nr:DNA-binding protein [Paludibacter sp.]